MTTFKQKINTARKLKPQAAVRGTSRSVWGVRTVSDPAKLVEVEIRKGKHTTSVNGKGKITHGQYICNVRRIEATGVIKYFGPHELEYVACALLGEAKEKKRKIIFYKDLKSVMLKKKIQNVSMIEVRIGKQTFWGVVENELS